MTKGFVAALQTQIAPSFKLNGPEDWDRLQQAKVRMARCLSISAHALHMHDPSDGMLGQAPLHSYALPRTFFRVATLPPRFNWRSNARVMTINTSCYYT